MKENKQIEQESKQTVGSETSSKMYWCNSIIKLSLVILLVSIILFYLLAWFYTSEFKPIHLIFEELLPLDGPFKVNNHRLGDAALLFENDPGFNGPESLIVHKGAYFTGLNDGRIVKLENSRLSNFSHTSPLGSLCKNQSQCGRPLGIKHQVKDDILYVVDAYNGIVKVDINSGKSELIFPFKNDNKFKVTFFDDIAIVPDGRIVVTELSTKYSYDEILKCVMEGHDDGRIIMIDFKKHTYTVLAVNLAQPNGIEVDPLDPNNYVIFGARDRLYKLNYNTGKVIPFSVNGIERIPGFIDNIRPSSLCKNCLWLGVYMTRYSQMNFDIIGFWSNKPTFRRMLNLIPKEWALSLIFPKSNIAMVILVDAGNGKVMDVLYDGPKQKLYHVTQVTEEVIRDSETGIIKRVNLLLMNYCLPFLAKLDNYH